MEMLVTIAPFDWGGIWRLRSSYYTVTYLFYIFSSINFVIKKIDNYIFIIISCFLPLPTAAGILV